MMRRVLRPAACVTALSTSILTVSIVSPMVTENAFAATRARPAECARSYDPYQQSVPFLTGCGDKVYPLEQVRPLPGGGKEYVYHVAGAKTVYKVPPRDFQPRKASDAKLKEYGLPTRAEAAEDHVDWSTVVGDAHPLAPPKRLVGIRARAGQYQPATGGAARGATGTTGSYKASSNWSGWETYRTSSSPTYRHAYGRWKEPSYQSTSCGNNAEVTWTGLGGWKSGIPLAQDGTAYHVSGMGPHQAWSEVLPDQPYMIPQQLYATSGRPFTALVKRTGGSFFFFMKNQLSGKSLSYYVSSSHFNGGTAEVVAERPTVNGSLTNLSKWVKLEVYSASAITSSGGPYQPFGHFPNVPIRMYNGSHYLAGPGSMFNGGKSFYAHFYRCS